MALKEDRTEPANCVLASDFECRVKFKSREIVDCQLKKYKALLNILFNDQSHIPEGIKTDLVQELMTTFDSTVEQNSSIDGFSSEDVFFENGDAITMDDLLDDKIVDTTSKRRCYPMRIVPFVLRSLKAEREQMEMYEHVINQDKVEPQTSQDDIMKNVLGQAATHYKETIAVMKSFEEVCERAEGLHQVLSMQPSSSKTSEI
ncbi:kinetochore-associated protein NSL1 homolog [Engraulis encrasicolus]|uniref:kinetochore-associated protein NSL1 homolog n=1 Tax=Engraulis encrasicolus TaxID=184585 RepID=UPI002FD778BB